MLSLLQRHFFWPRMETSVREYLAGCPRCVLRKAKPDAKAPLTVFVPQTPLQIVALDFLSLSRPMDQYQNILVMTDLFTQFAWAVPTLNQTAVTTA